MKSTKLLVMLLFCRFAFCEQNISDIKLLTLDFLNSSTFAKSITIYCCWNNGDLIGFAKFLMKNGYKCKTMSVEDNELVINIGHYETFLIDMKCNGTLDLLRQAEELKLFNKPQYRWLILNNDSLHSLEDFYFGVASNIFMVTNRHNNIYEINAIFKYSLNCTSFVKNFIASWTIDERFSRLNQLIPVKNRSNLMGSAVRISYAFPDEDSLNHLWDYRNRHIDSISKVSFLLLKSLVNLLNGTEVSIIRDTWGFYNATIDSYTGMFGDIKYGRADIGGTPGYITEDRLEFVDFICMHGSGIVKFLFRAPPLSSVHNLFVLTFDPHVWYASILLTGIIFVVLYFIAKWEWDNAVFGDPNFTDRTPSLQPKVSDLLMLEVRAISQQGTDVEPKSISGRLATILTFLILMFIYTSFSANIVALLQSTTDSIRTLEDLYNSKMEIGAEDVPYAHHYFRVATEPIKKTIFEEKIAPKGKKSNFMKGEDGIRKMQKGYFAFHILLSAGYKLIGDIFQENEKCGLKEIIFVDMKEAWLSTEKDSPYKKVFKVGLAKIHERGIRSREIRMIYAPKPTCHSKGSNFGSVGWNDCFYAFIIYGTAIIISFLLLIFEILLMQYKNRKIFTVHRERSYFKRKNTLEYPYIE